MCFRIFTIQTRIPLHIIMRLIKIPVRIYYQVNSLSHSEPYRLTKNRCWVRKVYICNYSIKVCQGSSWFKYTELGNVKCDYLIFCVVCFLNFMSFKDQITNHFPVAVYVIAHKMNKRFLLQKQSNFIIFESSPQG